MGIVNVTPDSFSDGGKYFKIDKAIDHALRLIDDGADIIDIGGESTRPGSIPIDLNEELIRTIPVVKKIFELRKDAIISIDTTKSEVARQAIESGAEIINDISGLTYDQNIIDVAAEFDAAVVLMHIKGHPKTMQDNPYYKDVLEEVCSSLKKKITCAKAGGLNRIILDPGIGFGKRIEDNFNLLKNLEHISYLGYPVLIGLSKKSLIGTSLNLDIDHREIGTIILETVAVMNSARIIRTHNVKYCHQLVKLATHFLQSS